MCKWFKQKKSVEKITVGVAVTSCSQCEQYNLGIEIYNLFKWPSHGASAIRYDKETDEIIVSEQAIMRIIQIANPIQEAKKLRLVSRDEFHNRKKEGKNE